VFVISVFVEKEGILNGSRCFEFTYLLNAIRQNNKANLELWKTMYFFIILSHYCDMNIRSDSPVIELNGM